MNKVYKLQRKLKLNDGHNIQKLENECENLRSQVFYQLKKKNYRN